MAGTIFKASVIALIVALVFPISIALATGESVHYKTPMIPSEYYSLSYEEQQSWRKENEVRHSGFSYLKEVLAEPFYIWQLFWSVMVSFVVVFSSCVVMASWERRGGKGV